MYVCMYVCMYVYIVLKPVLLSLFIFGDWYYQ
jgi:hypothetical protein